MSNEVQQGPGISIILPTYNRADLLRETIGTVIHQSFPNWELIIVDDQSTDNSEEIARSFHDKRIIYQRTNQRLGITGTRNAGLEMANGEWIAFIDSDDLWDSTKLQKQVTAMREFPQAGFSLTGGLNFRVEERAMHRNNNTATGSGFPGEVVDYFYQERKGLRVGNLLHSFFQSELSTTTSSLLFRKECLVKTGLFDKDKTFAEVDLILKLASLYDGLILYEPLLFRRLHGSNISGKEWKLGYEEGLALIRAYKDKIPEELYKQARFRLLIDYGEDEIRHRNTLKAFTHFFKAWMNKPSSVAPLKKSMKAILHKINPGKGND